MNVAFQRRVLLKGALIFVGGIILTVIRLNKHIEKPASYEYPTRRQILWSEEEDEHYENCSMPNAAKFPIGLFSQSQRDNGAIVVHILVSIYIFGAIAYVCAVYFVPSIELICQNFNIRSDVAGASFMAAGSSAPELFTAIIGTFVVQGDIGIDAIVGSAGFNILFIMGLCPFFSEKPIQLSWYPIIRDAICWAISVTFLIVTIYDSLITWWEATILSVSYFLYLTLMYFNGYVSKYAVKLQEKMDNNVEPESVDESTFILEIVHNTENNHKEFDLFPTDDEETEKKSSVFSSPESPAMYVCWVLGLPVITVYYLTIPDCRRKGWEKTYFITFVMGTIWMAGLSYILIWMITVIGHTVHISDDVMGLTFLAIGTSLPDLFASIGVVKDGYGDMAVANIIGSNVFEILVCLGCIWLVKILSNGGDWDPIVIGSESLVLLSTGLIVTSVFMILSLHLKDWELDKRLGVVLIIAYIVFISILVVLNVHGSKSKDILSQCPLL
ncbi:sodium/potassium/calcium exchanger 5-like [Antedon mediterranea]|uniref:sodium/potassium/calcium exchanger 5-like n=1 Tax=Antedon mediterranea TaxID=105859 RepID=UPI003AF41768